MSGREPFFGSVMIITVTALYINAGLDFLDRHPDWTGAIMAVGMVSGAFFTARSIYRDRVA